MPAPDRFQRLAGTRIMADPVALDPLEAPDGGHLLRLAPDDVLLLPAVAEVEVDDPYAIIEPEAGFSGAVLDEADLPRLQAACGWKFPCHRPAFAQGAAAGIPVKLLFGTDGKTLVLAPTVLAHHMEERLLHCDGGPL